MKILSFDVGIKNLAYCIIDINKEKHTILEWKIINCAEEILNSRRKCCVLRRKGICNKIAINKVIINDDNILGFCELKTCQKELHIHSKKTIKKIKKIRIKDIGLDIIGTNIYKALKNINFLEEIDIIIIENQPVLKNPTMKSVQMLLYGGFIYDKLNNDYKYSLKLFNASRKLQIYSGPEIDIGHIKNKYAQRKYLAIKYAEFFIQDMPIWKELFHNSSKKDDLADSYLQALTYFKKTFNK
tara:strand:- start:18655 stop:19380 length:726 start_codon:yes stop_codon:yes gene_type:complete